MTFFDELRADHRRFLGVLKRLEDLGEGRDRLGSRAAAARETVALLGRLLVRLGEHEDREQRLLLPALQRKVRPAAGSFDWVDAEHSRIERMVIDTQDALMSATRPPAHPLAASLKPLIEALRVHILREEAELFSVVENGFTSDELEGLRTDAQELPESIDLGVGD